MWIHSLRKSFFLINSLEWTSIFIFDPSLNKLAHSVPLSDITIWTYELGVVVSIRFRHFSLALEFICKQDDWPLTTEKMLWNLKQLYFSINHPLPSLCRYFCLFIERNRLGFRIFSLLIWNWKTAIIFCLLYMVISVYNYWLRILFRTHALLLCFLLFCFLSFIFQSFKLSQM